MTAALDIARLENVHTVGGKTIARCPACAEAGEDKSGDHLMIQSNGTFGCIQHSGPDGHPHRQQIHALVGVVEPKTAAPMKTRSLRQKKTHLDADSAVKAALWSLNQEQEKVFKEIKRWPYQNAAGELYAYMIRFEPDGNPASKTFRPIHKTAGGWQCGDPAKWFPYALPEILKSTGPVFVCEGEKAADAGRSIGLVCTTSAHGAESPGNTDWQSLAGRELVILPDHDPAGETYADKVFKIATGLNPAATVRIIRLPGLSDKGDLHDFVEVRDAQDPATIRLEVETLATQAEPRAQAEAKPPAGTLVGIDARLWLDTEPPAPDQIFCDAFDAGDKVSVIGSSKMGKSFFVLQAALSIAAGRDFLTWKITKPRHVLLAQFEITTKHFHRRVRNMARAMGISAEDIGDRLLIFNCRGITGETAIEQIGEEAKKYHAEVIIFDPLYKLTEGDENATKDMKPTLAAFDRLAEATGAAVIYVHHDAKGRAGDRDSRDRGAGSNVGRRDDDFCITITAHDTAESSVVIDCLWRNYKPRDPFTATWTERGCFEYMPDMPAVKKTSKSRSATTTARPALETYQDAAMNLIAQKPMSISLFREKIETMAGMNRERQRRLVELLLTDGKLAKYCIRGKGLNKAWIGTPEQIKEMRQIKMNV